MIKQKKDAGIIRNRKEKTTKEKLTIQLDEINQKVLAKEGRLKRYRQRVKQYKQNRTFQNNDHSLDILDPFSSGPETNLNKWTKEQET